MPWLLTPPRFDQHSARWSQSQADDAFSLRKAAEPDEETARMLSRLADEAMLGMLGAVEAVFTAVGVSLSRETLAGLVSIGDRGALERLVSEVWQNVGERGLRETLIPRMRALALQAAERTVVPGVAVAFNVADPLALAAINAVGGAKITAISDTTREAVRGIVTRTFNNGLPLAQQIAEIAEVVGLTERQALSLSHFRDGLIEAGEKPGRIETLVERRATVLRRQRAEMIARTESMDAVHVGQQEGWRQSLRDGLFKPGTLQRFWVLGPRPCPLICALIPGMNPDGVGLEIPFQTPKGPLMHPTAHPRCMCAVIARVAA